MSVMDRVWKLAGMPEPVELARENGAYRERELAGRVAIVGQAPGSISPGALREAMKELGADVHENAAPNARVLAFDATGCRTPASLRALYDFFHPLMPALARCARILVVAADGADDPLAAATARAVEGFTRALAKEAGRRGATANLFYLSKGASIAGAARFFTGDRGAYVSGQAIHVREALPKRDLRGATAVVTGAARGLGAATARRLAAEGARVVTIDIKGADVDLDITAPDAPARIAEAAGGPIDIMVHNAGITRDRTLGKMDPAQWDAVIAVNFDAIARIDKAIVPTMRPGARIVMLSSVSGIAGNAGQTNYSATKAALIGYAAAQGKALAPRGIGVNAVAPGFIETEMVKTMPFMTREMARRLNSLSQGGRAEDVAELVTFLSSPDAAGISGQTIRVCGQALIGA